MIPQLRYDGEDLTVRFWRYVRKTPTGCWLWSGKRSRGYGQLYDERCGRTVGAHRISYELLVGPIPFGRVIDHLCQVKHCVNPAHLEQVSNRENTIRARTPVVPHLHGLLQRRLECKTCQERSSRNVESFICQP